MPVAVTYPGVYIEEVPSGVRSIAGVATSIAAFVDAFPSGPLNRAVRVADFGEFERTFGGLSPASDASYGILQFFLNGGSDAYVVRVTSPTSGNAATAASVTLKDNGTTPAPVLTVTAVDPGSWGNALHVGADYDAADPAKQFNLTITETATVNAVQQVVATESFRNLVNDPAQPNDATAVVNAGSQLVRLSDAVKDKRPAPSGSSGDTLTGGSDGIWDPTLDEAGMAAGLIGDENAKSGLYALHDVDLFNILCVPATARLPDDAAGQVIARATKLCTDRRAMYIVDPPQTGAPSRDTPLGIAAWLGAHGEVRSRNSALYAPRVRVADPLNGYRLKTVANSGTLAGVWAATDAARGVWKAPAGTSATLAGVQELAYKLTDAENGNLNPLAVNALRTFPVFGPLAWGARTTKGADQLVDDYKYIPVRRLALYIEESLFRGTQWVVFEPNDAPLWSQIRLNAGAFMQQLFVQGAFAGTTPAQAYFVQCDDKTNPQASINLGIVNVIVGFAPLKPAEFVVIHIQQIAGQIAT